MYYFYIIEHIKTGLLYAGSRTSKRAKKNELLSKTGYKTSSKYVKRLIDQDGLSSFVVRKIKYFVEAQEAYVYETRFLRKVKAATNANFLNMHENNKGINAGSSEYKEKMKISTGYDHPLKNPEIVDRMNSKIIEKYGDLESYYKYRSRKSFESYSKNNGHSHMFKNPDMKNIIREGVQRKYGYNSAFEVPSIRKKASMKSAETQRLNNSLTKHDPRIQLIEKSDIDFTKYGWIGKVSALIDVSSTHVTRWMSKHMPDLFETCYKRKSG